MKTTHHSHHIVCFGQALTLRASVYSGMILKYFVYISGSIASTVGHSIMCHEETMTVCLFPNHAGLGIILHSNTLPTEPMDSPPFIGTLDPNCSAER